STVAFSSFSVTVTAKDQFNNTDTAYTGTAHFTSSDSQAVLPADYTFQAADNGTQTFSSVVLKTGGNQTITATDTVTLTITGTATILVNQDDTTTAVSSSVNPSTFGQSVTFTATVTGPGTTPSGTVQFKIDGTNYGSPQTPSGGRGVSRFTPRLSAGQPPR